MTSNNGVLIIGATPQGLQAAVTLAYLGRQVTLIEQGFQIPDVPKSWGGKGRRWHHYLCTQLSHHPLIKLSTETEVTKISEVADIVDVDMTQGAQWVLPELCVDCGQCLTVCPVEQPDGRKPLFERVVPTSMAIDKREKAPCRTACPIGMNPQAYVALIVQGRIDEADELIRESNPLAGICGRICHHPCETACRRQEIDEPIAICALKRFAADEARKKARHSKADAVPTPQGLRIAIVGSGPAGLTAAHDLARAGLRPTIIEGEAGPGGLMRQAIAPFRLPREILDQEISDIVELGVEVRLNTWVRTLEDLETLKAEGFAAILLATGASRDLSLNMAGEDLEGVYGCVSFLRRLWSGQSPERLGRAIIIGGGNAAVEAARACIRAGAEGVSLVCLEKREEMPAWAHEIEAALEEGVEIINSFGPQRFLQEAGRISGVVFKRCTSVFDENGAFKPRFDETERITVSGATAIVAIGQARNLCFEHGGQIPNEGETDIAGVYACGDVVSGPTTVVQAMASGRRAARMIIGRLTSFEAPIDKEETQPPRGEYEPIPKGMPQEPRRPVPHRKVSERIKDNREVIGPYSVQEAITEACRCLQCGLCSECLRCEAACDLGAIRHDRNPAQQSFRFDHILVCDDTQIRHDLESFRRVRVAERGKRDSWSKAVISGRAAAMAVLNRTRKAPLTPVSLREFEDGDLRAGVFICSCNGTLNGDGRLEEMIGPLQALPGVAHVEVVVSACHPEKGRAIEGAMDKKALNGALIASCTCCHFNFACESCNDQRIRLKQRLFGEDGYSPGGIALVNVKETCLLPFKEDGQRGRELALRMIRSGLSQLKKSRTFVLEGEKPCPRALVLGATEAGIAAAIGLKTTCPSVVVAESGRVAKGVEKLLSENGIDLMSPVKPLRLEGRRGDFTLVVEQKAPSGKGPRYDKISAALIILGKSEYRNISYKRDAFARTFRSRRARAFGTLETGISGVYLASWSMARDLSHESVGLSACSEALEGTLGGSDPNDYLFAQVDPELCRGCGRCAEICPEGAAYLEETTRGVACSWVDPRFCTGCGNCLAECPTGAIHLPESEQDDYEKVIHALLG